MGAGAVHGSSLLVADAQTNKEGISNNTNPDSGSTHEPREHATATADGQRSSAGDVPSDQYLQGQANQSLKQRPTKEELGTSPLQGSWEPGPLARAAAARNTPDAAASPQSPSHTSHFCGLEAVSMCSRIPMAILILGDGIALFVRSSALYWQSGTSAALDDELSRDPCEERGGEEKC